MHPLRVFATSFSLALLGVVLPAFEGSAASAVQRSSPLVKEVVPHARVGDFVTFDLDSAPRSIVLQGFSPRSGKWRDLAMRTNPRVSLAQLRIPHGWSEAELRVVASYRSESARRERIRSKTDHAARTVTFTATSRARLFSVEYRADTASPWARVSTVAAASPPRAVTVPLPELVPANSEIRVVAVSGPRSSRLHLKTPLSEEMRSGQSTFAPSLKAAAEPSLQAPSQTGLFATLGASRLSDSRSGASVVPEESDIWKTRGSTIYFFNRLRGLQIIDTTDPSSPTALAGLPLAGAGEEMYLLGSDPAHADAAVLVTSVPWNPSSPEATRINRISLGEEQPVLETFLELPGYYVDSRLAGHLLHVVTASWTSAGGDWSPRTFVTSIDISSEAELVASVPVSFNCVPRAVGSTSKYFWFAGTSSDAWSEHSLFAFPLKLDGSLAQPLRTSVGGVVQDKFKVGDTSDGLAVVVQNWSGWQQATFVETYGEENGGLAPRAKIELVRGEQLFATRFDGHLLYAVTFEQIDPLWVVDLSDPSAPAIKGHLEVPGWSTFLEPIDDVLVAVGRDEGEFQVSIFDVSDVGLPTLAARIAVGGAGGGWSSSEAEWSEKAVRIIPEAGLILLPVSEWTGTTQTHKVRLVDFDPAARTLALRGTIDHDFSPRRAALMDSGLIASVSNRELLLVDALHRDNPEIASETTLAFGVDRLLVHNGVALMFENGGAEWSGSPRHAMLRTAPAGDTDAASFEISLPGTRVEGAKIFEDKMLVVESSGHGQLWALGHRIPGQENSGECHLSVWSLADPAQPILIGRVPLPFAAGGETDILAVDGGRVVVATSDHGRGFLVRPLPVTPLGVATVSSGLRASLPWFGWGNHRLDLCVVDISDGDPVVLGKWELAGEEITGISDVFAAGDLLAFSYESRDAAGKATRGFVPQGWSSWRTRSWLQIVDLADPGLPMPWAPVQLPGELLGISWLQRAGGVLFARSDGEKVAALGFDGENAAIASEISVSPVAVIDGASLYFPTVDGVAEWRFSEDLQHWQPGPGWIFTSGHPIDQLHSIDGALLAGSGYRVWALREDGSMAVSQLPDVGNLGQTVIQGDGFTVPAGEYGAITFY